MRRYKVFILRLPFIDGAVGDFDSEKNLWSFIGLFSSWIKYRRFWSFCLVINSDYEFPFRVLENFWTNFVFVLWFLSSFFFCSCLLITRSYLFFLIKQIRSTVVCLFFKLYFDICNRMRVRFLMGKIQGYVFISKTISPYDWYEVIPILTDRLSSIGGLEREYINSLEWFYSFSLI